MKKKQESDVLSGEFRKFINDIEGLVKQTANLTGDELVLAREKLDQRVNEARGSVTTMSSDLARKASKSAAKANRKVHDEPWKVIGGAAALGLILGMLFARD